MRRAIPFAAALALLLITGPFMRPALAGWVVDQAGRRVHVPEHPKRVVALAPSATEIVYDLGRGDLLVGATLYSTTPPEAAALPKVGSYVQLDLERIVALAPDLCIGIRDGNPKHVVERLEALGIPVYVVDPKTLDEVASTVETLGGILGAGEKGRALAADMRARIRRVRETAARAPSRPRVFFQIDAAPIVSAGSGTFIDQLITLAGGRNLASGPVAYPRFGWEDVLTMDPQVVIITSMAGGYSPEALRAIWARWPSLPAVKNKRIHVVNADLIDRPTPRLVDGLEAFARIIHPELFGGPHGR